MKEIKKILKPLKRKMNIEKFLRYFLWAEMIAFAVIFVILLASKFVYIKNITVIFSAIIATAFVVAIVSVIIKRTTMDQAAKMADKLCLKERLSTALEIVQNETQSTMDNLLIKDAIEKGRQAQPEKNYKLVMPKNALKVLVVVIIAIFATGFIKSPNLVDIGGLLNSNIKEIEQVKKEVNAEKIIVGEDIKELNQQINTLTKSLKKASSKKEAIQTMDKAQQEIKNLEKTGVSKDLKNISESLSADEASKNLGEAIKSGDTKAMNTSLEELNSQLEELGDEDLQALLNAMNDALENVDNEELKEALSNYAGQIASGNFNPSANNLHQVKDSLEAAVASRQNLQEKVADLNELIAQATQVVENNNVQSVDSQQSSGQEPNQSGGNTNGQGNGEGEGGVGKGEGSGEGKGGNGRGNGHVETEEIYSREAGGKSGYDTQIEGAENTGGDTEISKQQTTGTAGESVPYDQVIGEYKEEALKSIDESNVPYGMKELVADYFSALEK